MAKVNEEKFRKMKNIYSNLREEHVKLLRTVCISRDQCYSIQIMNGYECDGTDIFMR